MTEKDWIVLVVGFLLGIFATIINNAIVELKRNLAEGFEQLYFHDFKAGRGVVAKITYNNRLLISRCNVDVLKILGWPSMSTLRSI